MPRLHPQDLVIAPAYSDTTLTPGQPYLYRVRATNDVNDSVYSNVTPAVTTPVTVAYPIKINFQAGQTPPVPGYKVDIGSVFGDRGDGLSYGWSEDISVNDRERGINPDRRLDTLIHFQAGANWQIAVPNGTYDVTVSIGDAAYPSTHTINVNGVSYWDALPLAADNFGLMTKTVDVTDGFVTIDQGDAADRATRIDYVEIATGANPALPVATIVATDSDGSEQDSDPAQFTVARSGSTDDPLTVNYTISGTASSADYSENLTGSILIPAGQPSATIDITPVDDAIAEGDESLVLTLAADSAYSRGSPFSAAAIIRDNEPAPQDTVIITATDPDASEYGPDKGTFTVTRFGPTTSHLIAFYTFTGSAATSADYLEPLSGVVVIHAGSSSASFNVTPIDDGEAEGDELVVAKLLGEGYSVGDPGSAAVTIHDNDTSNAPAPAAPSGLTAVRVDADTVRLDWQHPGGDLGGFVVEESTNDGLSYDWAGSAGSTDRTTQLSINSDTDYLFRVYAYNSGGHSGYSNVAALAAPAPALVAPGELHAAGNYRWIDLTWTDRSVDEDGYKVQQLKGGAYVTIATLEPDRAKYTVDNLAPATNYSFRVLPFNSAEGDGPYAQISATTKPAIPNAPDNVTTIYDEVGGVGHPTGVRFSWIDSSDNEDYFRIRNIVWTRHSSESGIVYTVNWAPITVAPSPGVGNFVVDPPYDQPDLAVPYGMYPDAAGWTTLDREVIAHSASGDSDMQPPAAPTNLTAQSISETQINLQWTDNADNEEGYLVEMAGKDGAWNVIGELGANGTSFAATGLQSATSYAFRVRAYNAKADSPYSNTVRQKTQGNPGVINHKDDGVPCLTYGEVKVDGQTVTVGKADRAESDGQPSSAHGFSVLLPPQSSYSLTLGYDLHTWDSYNDDSGSGTGYWDSFSASVTSAPYPDIESSDPLQFPFVWGGTHWGDGVIESNSGSQNLTFTGNPAGNNYLNIVLDTGTPPAADGAYPSWGTFTVSGASLDCPPDLDVDSNNDGAIAGDDDAIEDDASKPGKIVAVDDDDADGDGVADFADFNGITGKSFTPVQLAIPPDEPLANMKIKLNYDASDPIANVIPPGESASGDYEISGGHLRLWTKDGSSARNGHDLIGGGDWIKSDTAYTPAQLGITDANRTVTLYLEAVAPSTAQGDQRIEVQIAPNGVDFTGSDAVRTTAYDLTITKVISDQIPGVAVNYLPGGTGYDGPEYTGNTIDYPGGHVSQPNYLLVGTRGSDDRLYIKAGFSLRPDIPAIRQKLQFALYDEHFNATLPQLGGPTGNAPLINNTITGNTVALSGFPITAAPTRPQSASDLPNIYVSWGMDDDNDGRLVKVPRNPQGIVVNEVQSQSPYTIKAVTALNYGNAQSDANLGRFWYDYTLGRRPYTDNFLYAFQNNLGLAGAYNYPGGGTVQADEFKLDHNLGALFNSQGFASVNKAVFVPFATSTLPDPSHLVDDVSVSATLASLIDATFDANKQIVRSWFANPVNAGQELHTFVFNSAEREITFKTDPNQDLYTAMGDAVSSGVSLSVTVSRKSDAAQNVWWLESDAVTLSGNVTDLYDFRADTFPAILGAIIQAGYDGSAQRPGGQVFKYELDFEGSPSVPHVFYFQNTPPL